MKLELTEAECQYVITSIDTYVRQTGITNAMTGLDIVKKLQDAKKLATGDSGGG